MNGYEAQNMRAGGEVVAMNAEKLFYAMKNGGKLISRSWQTHARLKMPDGTLLLVQKSNVHALVKSKAIRSILWSGWIEYQVNDATE